MDKLTLQATKYHIANNAKVEILNYKCDYVGIQYSIANGYYFIEDQLHMTYNGGSTGKSINDFRLHLRPLSELTQEIEHNGETIVPIIELFKLKTQVTGSEIFDYYIENNTAILRIKSQQLEEYTFRCFFEIDLEPNEVAFSIVSETWVDDEMIQEHINQSGGEMSMYHKLYELHFDVFGLIPKGLAIDINTVETEVQNG